MTEKNDPPIEPQDFLGGVRVVDIGDYRVSRGLSRRSSTSCPHRRMVYDGQERRIWCRDCEKDVEAFDAFQIIVANFSRKQGELARREQKVSEAESHSLISVAAKVMDDAWRKKDMVPCCPHCSGALFPENFKRGISGFLGKSYALEQLRLKNKQPGDGA